MEAKSKRSVFKASPETATDVDERANSARREGVQDLNALAPALVLILGTDRVIPLIDLSEGDGRDAASKE